MDLRAYLLEYPVEPKVDVPITLSKPMKVQYGQSFGQDFSYTLPDGTYIESFYGQWGLDGHGGIDFPAAKMTPIYAPCDLWVDNYHTNPTYGDILWAYSDSWEIDGKEYRLEMNFGHLHKEFVSNKQVKRGEQIAWSGNTGYPKTSTGPHLHWGVRLQQKINGKWVKIDTDNGYRGYFNQYLIMQDMLTCKRVDNKEIYAIDEITKTRHHISNVHTYALGVELKLWSEFEDVPTVDNYKAGSDIMLNPLDE